MAAPIELQDVTRVLSQLVMPSPRRHPQGGSAAMKNLAPIEMAAHSIHLHQPYHGNLVLHSAPSSSSVSLPKSQGAAIAIPIAPEPALPQSSASAKCPPLMLQGWLIPVGYAGCGLCMGLCNLIMPASIGACAHLLCPVWTLTLGMHAATEPDPAWAWCGVMCILLLPWVILVRELLFVGFYLLVFTTFSVGRFWQTFQGPLFILLAMCWAGLFVCCGLSLASDRPYNQISVAGFFSLSASVISSSRLNKLVLRVS